MELSTKDEGKIDISPNWMTQTEHVTSPFDAVKLKYQTAISKQIRPVVGRSAAIDLANRICDTLNEY